jgi:hypothetical protein
LDPPGEYFGFRDDRGKAARRSVDRARRFIRRSDAACTAQQVIEEFSTMPTGSFATRSVALAVDQTTNQNLATKDAPPVWASMAARQLVPTSIPGRSESSALMVNEMEAPVTAALIAGSVAAIGWIAGHFLATLGSTGSRQSSYRATRKSTDIW